MKTDTQLRADVLAELRDNPVVNEADMEVAVKDGVVTLSGCVRTYEQRYVAEWATREVAGVRGLAMRVEVRPGARSSAAGGA
jgi:osmotically-inducible protein OsmY